MRSLVPKYGNYHPARTTSNNNYAALANARMSLTVKTHSKRGQAPAHFQFTNFQMVRRESENGHHGDRDRTVASRPTDKRDDRSGSLHGLFQNGAKEDRHGIVKR
jgi:hypothetical protein